MSLDISLRRLLSGFAGSLCGLAPIAGAQVTIQPLVDSTDVMPGGGIDINGDPALFAYFGPPSLSNGLAAFNGVSTEFFHPDGQTQRSYTGVYSSDIALGGIARILLNQANSAPNYPAPDYAAPLASLNGDVWCRYANFAGPDVGRPGMFGTLPPDISLFTFALAAPAESPDLITRDEQRGFIISVNNLSEYKVQRHILSSGTTTDLLDNTAVVPDAAGRTFAVFHSIHCAGDQLVIAGADAGPLTSGVYLYSKTGVYRETVVSSADTPLPGLPSAFATRYGTFDQAVMHNADIAVVVAGLGSQSATQGLIARINGVWRVIAATGSSLPGMEASQTVSNFDGVSIHDGAVAFVARVGSVDRFLYVHRDAKLTKIIGAGDPFNLSFVGNCCIPSLAICPTSLEAGNLAVTIATIDGNAGVYVARGFGGPCAGDFNTDGFANSQDFFDFLTAFFALDPTADFNHDDQINSQDYFDFINAFFAGC